MEREEIELRIDVKDMLNILPERYKAVLVKRFFESKTLKAIGIDFGVTPERIRQMEAKALNMIRRNPNNSNSIKALRDFKSLKEYYLR